MHGTKNIKKLYIVASCLHIYWNILTMHGPMNVKSPNNTSKWQMGFNSAFKGLSDSNGVIVAAEGREINSRACL
jgi:hypothetical protein